MSSIASIKPGSGGADSKAKPEKQAKVKLTKEQHAFVKDVVKLENRIGVCREYIALWMSFFRFFAEDLTQKEITAADEKAFFQVSSQLARKHFMFVELMSDRFERGQDIIGVLSSAVSLSTLQTMPENTRSKLELDWHSLFLDMNKTLGRLLRLLPGNLTLAQALEKMSQTNSMAPANSPQAKAAADKKKK